MVILFENKKIRNIANSISLLVENYGREKARKIRQRLDEIHAASNLHDLHKLLNTKCYCDKKNQEIIKIQTVNNSHLITAIFQNNLARNYRWEDVTIVSVISLDGGENEKYY